MFIIDCNEGGIHPSILSKGEQRGRRCLFIIGLGAGKFLMWRRIFARISPNFHEKLFVQLLPTNSLPQRSSTPFLWPPKKVFVWFSANLGRHFLKSSKVGRHFLKSSKVGRHFLKSSKVGRHFLKSSKVRRHFHADFQQIKTSGVALAPPPPTPLLFISASSVIS